MLEEKITIGDKFKLDGLLTIPDNREVPFPAVVLVHGSGPADMNAHIGNTYMFKDLAEGLANQGIATIRYDKRTFVYGKEMVKDHGLTVRDETIEDAIFASNLLKKDSRIDSEKVFIIGHSMGGMLAPRIDAEGGNFVGLIILAGSPRKLEKILVEQKEEVLKNSNAFIQWIANKQMKKQKKKFTKMYDLSDEKAKETPILGKNVRAYYLKEFGEKLASTYLKDLQKPILVMQGDSDFQVSVDKDFEAYKRLLSDHSDVTFNLYPRLNHLFMPSIFGDIRKAKKEYEKAQNVDEKVLNDIANWIQSH